MEPSRSLLILVVDDEPPVIDLLQRLGQQIFPEAQFVSTNSARETLDFLADQTKPRPHLILLDIDLHQAENGLDLLPQLRAKLRGQVPIIMFTVSDAKPDIREAYAAGAVAYTHKPEHLEGWKQYVEMLKRYWYSINRLPGTIID